MELSPAAITGVEFDQVRKGYDTGQVRSFLGQIARGVELMKAQIAEEQNRSRQAQARLAELPRPAADADAESISRALVLAQRTADAAIAEARNQAAAIIAAAEDRAQAMANDAESKAAERIVRAETEARRRGEDERNRVDTELRDLLQRRDRAQTELDRIERSLLLQREQVRVAIDRLHEVLAASAALDTPRAEPARAESPDGSTPEPVAPPAVPVAVGTGSSAGLPADESDEGRWRPGPSA